ncbi:Serine/threonine-protein phosphatase PP1 [Tritrichomonas foetus]|uniref:Serine/threonine-protein phosphatase n=1 Tax=Tritrichomonas foetus TaxID=1144522 RepID=A0A1J4JL24_9EUKA|nr:Serine/threonine-protein phosphatase PP1 [Tritrichomonas foetus]|eukprot:OHS98261.1 Serine/threonine-protein phosphatase PP1 [Tritrichomonas foetus]
MNFNEKLQDLLQWHIDQISKNIVDMGEGRQSLQLPTLEEDFVINIAKKAQFYFNQEPLLLELHPPIVVVGDLHGHLLNLYQILQNFDLPPNQRYLILGDIVDRGAFSIETVSLLFALKICYPDNIYIIRGNHEFSSVSTSGGFFEELASIFNSQSVFNSFNEAFNFMPLAAQIGPYICLHGGISPELQDISQIKGMKRPISCYSDPLLCGIFWSDPNEEIKMYKSSNRGVGFLFGKKPLRNFLNINNVQILIRGHECVDGYSYRFNNRCITVFSASNYCGVSENHAAVLQIVNDFSLIPKILPYVKYLKRANAIFLKNTKPLIKSETNVIASTSMEAPAFARAMKATKSRAKTMIKISKVTLKRRRNTIQPSLVCSRSSSQTQLMANPIDVSPNPTSGR